MKRVYVVVALFLLIPAVANAALVHNAILYETDFESPEYTSGYLVPQQGWTESWDSGTHANRGEVVASSGYGQVLYNYRAASGQQANHNYHSLGAVVDSGVVTLSFDARRVGTPSSTAWFNILDAGLNQVASVGMETPSSTAGFRVARSDNTYPVFGSLAWNTWYRVELELRLTGPDAGTYDVVARGPNGALAAEFRNEPFYTTGALPAHLRVRTYGPGSGVEVDNIRYEEGRVINQIMHGDFDRLEVGTWPNNGAPIGGWRVSTSSTEKNDNQLTIVQKPGAAAGDHALRVNVVAPLPANATYAEQLLEAPYEQGHHKFIMEHEQVTVAGMCGADVQISNGATRSSAASFGLRNEASGGAYFIRVWPGTSGVDLAPWTPGMTYQFRTSVDLTTDTFDLYVRSPDDNRYARWTQIGKEIAFPSGSGPFTQLDRVAFGQYYRSADAYVDNVVAVNSQDLPLRVLYTNNFQQYGLGNLVDQNDGWRMGEGAAYPARARVIADSSKGPGHFVQVDTGAPAARTSVYQDMDVVVESGIARFSVDAMWEGGVTNSWGYFGIGDSHMDMTLANDLAGLRSSVALFGFRGDNGQLNLMASDGDYLAGGGTLLLATASADTWYTFTAEAQMTGENRNTWDLRVFDRDTKSLIWERMGMDFVADFTDILRFGAYAYDSVGAGTLYFDNLGLANVPEPATGMLLALGLAMILVRRRRR